MVHTHREREQDEEDEEEQQVERLNQKFPVRVWSLNVVLFVLVSLSGCLLSWIDAALSVPRCLGMERPRSPLFFLPHGQLYRKPNSVLF